MDGLKGTVPMGVLKEEYHQMSLFEPFQEVEEADNEPEFDVKYMIGEAIIQFYILR